MSMFGRVREQGSLEAAVKVVTECEFTEVLTVGVRAEIGKIGQLQPESLEKIVRFYVRW